jgi:modulator of FtsH protease HflK
MTGRRSNLIFSAQATLDALRSSIRMLAWGMACLVLCYLSSGVAIIGPNEVGLILRLGRLQKETYPPGLVFSFPPPMDEVIKVPVKSVQEVPLDLWSPQGEESSLPALDPVTQPYTLTGDVNIVRASFVVRYQIVDPKAYALNIKDRESLRDAVLYESACRVLSSMNVEDALTVRKDYIGQEAMRLAQQRLDALNMGIQLSAFETREINPPRPVLPAFQAVVSAKVRAKTLVEEANTYEASALPAAKAEAYRIHQEADAYASQLVAKALGQSAAFTALLKEYRANPQLVRARLYGEMMASVAPKVKVSTVMPGDSGAMRILLDPRKPDAMKTTDQGGR